MAFLVRAVMVAFVVLTSLSGARAHEITPSIAVMSEREGRLEFRVETNLERLLAGINAELATHTQNAPEAAAYNALRQMEPAALEARFRDHWPTMARGLSITIDGTPVTPELDGLDIPETGDLEAARDSELRFSVPVPEGAETVEVAWQAGYGELYLRQSGVPRPYDGLLAGGASTGPVQLLGGDQPGWFESFLGYIFVGFDHIIPKGTDHILFVAGLFFFSTRLTPLLWQVTAFTAAHTLTLGLSASGIVSVPGSIVEPAIAASIAYVGIENVLSKGESRFRPWLVFAFGLLHGLGFASVLGDFGLPEGAFVPALLGFNVGVEFGQLAVLGVLYVLVALVMFKYPWYRTRVAVPMSIFIAVMGVLWFVERTVL
jgi:hypothetical protein